MAKAVKPKAKSPSKSEILKELSETSGLSKKDVQSVVDALTALIEKSVSKKGSGVLTLFGLMQIKLKEVPARPAQKGVKDPFTGNLVDRPAKPASKKVVVRPLKGLKGMV